MDTGPRFSWHGSQSGVGSGLFGGRTEAEIHGGDDDPPRGEQPNAWNGLKPGKGASPCAIKRGFAFFGVPLQILCGQQGREFSFNVSQSGL